MDAASNRAGACADNATVTAAAAKKIAQGEASSPGCSPLVLV
jgi:hypothetical protein